MSSTVSSTDSSFTNDPGYCIHTWQVGYFPREGGAGLQKKGGASRATPPQNPQMAEGKEEESAVVELVNLSTQKKEEAVLTGVKEVDLDSVDAVVSYITQRAETDEGLNLSDSNRLRYSVCRPGAKATTTPAPSHIIGQRLAFYSKVLAELMKNDPVIQAEDQKTIKKICTTQGVNGDETDGPSTIDFGAMRSHLFQIFSRLLSWEKISKSSPNVLLMNFAIIIQYCYNFCVRLIEYARSSSRVFDIFCQVSSAILSYLASIRWKEAVSKLGGWGQLASVSRATLEVVRYGHPGVLFGVAAVCAAAGVYCYFKSS